jgi:starvation-inducible DNA-binding protein
MHATRNDLPAATRTRVARLLNDRLADTLDLQLAAKHAHWNVRGPQFIALHELFDAIAAALAGQADTIAERITAFGGTAAGTLALAARGSTLKAYPPAIVDGSEHLAALADRLAALARQLRKAIDAADGLGDAGTADLFTAASREVDKQLWLVEAHLGARR